MMLGVWQSHPHLSTSQTPNHWTVPAPSSPISADVKGFCCPAPRMTKCIIELLLEASKLPPKHSGSC